MWWSVHGIAAHAGELVPSGYMAHVCCRVVQWSSAWRCKGLVACGSIGLCCYTVHWASLMWGMRRMPRAVEQRFGNQGVGMMSGMSNSLLATSGRLAWDITWLHCLCVHPKQPQQWVAASHSATRDVEAVFVLLRPSLSAPVVTALLMLACVKPSSAHSSVVRTLAAYPRNLRKKGVGGMWHHGLSKEGGWGTWHDPLKKKGVGGWILCCWGTIVCVKG